MLRAYAIQQGRVTNVSRFGVFVDIGAAPRQLYSNMQGHKALSVLSVPQVNGETAESGDRAQIRSGMLA